jgi:glycerol-3-phosphate acyltransferase PlsX
MISPLSTIALDAMGGNHGPAVVVPAAAKSLEKHPELDFLLFGDQARIQPHLQQYPALVQRSHVIHTEMVIQIEDKVTQAVRRGRTSSMWLALDAVKDGKARVAVSGGNTGALVAMAKLVFGTMRGVERPVIAGQWPTIDRRCIVLDLGGGVDATPQELVSFALFGAAAARALFEAIQPRVALLNIGVEDIKGDDNVREAHMWLKTNDLPLDYCGFVEADQIGQGAVDVIVTDGYAGNLALRTAEGTVNQIESYVREAFDTSFATRLGAILVESSLRSVRARVDRRYVNGAPLLGLNGIIVKSDENTDAIGFANAIGVARRLAHTDILTRLTKDLKFLHERLIAKPPSV